MCANNSDGVSGTPLATNGEGRNRGAVACQIIFAAWANGRCPRISLLDELESRFFESLRSRKNGMIS